MTTMTASIRSAYRKRSGGWGLAGAQLVYALWFTGCAVYAVTHYPDYEYIGLRGELLAMTAQVGLIMAAVSVVASGWLLVFGYARGHRLLTVALVAGTLAALATIVATISPAGQDVLGILLD
jgi:hypothetical protein